MISDFDASFWYIGNESKAEYLLSAGSTDIYYVLTHFVEVFTEAMGTSVILDWFHLILVGAMVGIVPGGPESCSKWVE
jgi:hypothetical protein